MKRDTREWLKRVQVDDLDLLAHPAADVLESHARQQARIRELTAALHEFIDLSWPLGDCSDREQNAIYVLKRRWAR